MQIITDIDQLRLSIKQLKQSQKTIGFVPTMGFLHQGHQKLIRQSTEENDICIVSTFVNPLQFGANEDLKRYPRDFEHDRNLCQENKVDILFHPPQDILTPTNILTSVNTHNLDSHLCGKSRPGHFTGVCTIVAKLFNLVTPDSAYFGQKDIQQLRIIQQMAADLNFAVKIVEVETVRESTGLALSSRNKYLTPSQKVIALHLIGTLRQVKEQVTKDPYDVTKVLDNAKQQLSLHHEITLDYLEIVDNKTLTPIKSINGSFIIAIAAFLGSTRLIDNIIVEK